MTLIQEYRSEYSSWYDMKNRCYNKKVKAYKNYGARGIKVCDRWMDSFESFLSDMGPKSGNNITLERIDVNADYTPDNCVWASREQQANNTRNNVIVKHGGSKTTVSRLAHKLGFNPSTLLSRISQRGMSVSEAVSRPLRKKDVISYNGEEKTVAEWADQYDLRYDTLFHRLNKLGWSIERAFTTPVKKREK